MDARERAQDPTTPTDELLELAVDYPLDVLGNPSLTEEMAKRAIDVAAREGGLWTRELLTVFNLLGNNAAFPLMALAATDWSWLMSLLDRDWYTPIKGLAMSLHDLERLVPSERIQMLQETFRGTILEPVVESAHSTTLFSFRNRLIGAIAARPRELRMAVKDIHAYATYVLVVCEHFPDLIQRPASATNPFPDGIARVMRPFAFSITV